MLNYLFLHQNKIQKPFRVDINVKTSFFAVTFIHEF